MASPSVARTVTLPTAGIKAGAEFELLVTGATEANYVVLNSSGANEVDRIGGQGKILVVALQDTPTTAAHWQVVDVWEKSSAITSGACTGANLGAVIATFYRQNGLIKAKVYQAAGTMANDSHITTPSFIPTRFQPTTGTSTVPGVMFIGGAGRDSHWLVGAAITAYKYDESLFGSASANYLGGPATYPSFVSWFVG
jgi:hypothetical protein